MQYQLRHRARAEGPWVDVCTHTGDGGWECRLANPELSAVVLWLVTVFSKCGS